MIMMAGVTLANVDRIAISCHQASPKERQRGARQIGQTKSRAAHFERDPAGLATIFSSREGATLPLAVSAGRSKRLRLMSAFGGKADITRTCADVRF